MKIVNLDLKNIETLCTRSQMGMSLVGLLVAASIGAIAVFGIGKVINLHLKATRHMSNNLDREAVKQMILGEVDCHLSMPDRTCAANTTIQVKDKNGNIMIPITGKSFAGPDGKGIKVFARCNGTETGIQFAMARPKSAGIGYGDTSTGNFRPDPLTGEVYRFTDPQASLFPSGVDMCVPELELYGLTALRFFWVWDPTVGEKPQDVPFFHNGSTDGDKFFVLDEVTKDELNAAVSNPSGGYRIRVPCDGAYAVEVGLGVGHVRMDTTTNPWINAQDAGTVPTTPRVDDYMFVAPRIKMTRPDGTTEWNLVGQGEDVGNSWEKNTAYFADPQNRVWLLSDNGINPTLNPGDPNGGPGRYIYARKYYNYKKDTYLEAYVYAYGQPVGITSLHITLEGQRCQ